MRDLVLELERRRESGVALREYDRDEPGLMYYERDAADGDQEIRAHVSARFVREVAGNISASFSELWPKSK